MGQTVNFSVQKTWKQTQTTTPPEVQISTALKWSRNTEKIIEVNVNVQIKFLNTSIDPQKVTLSDGAKPVSVQAQAITFATRNSMNEVKIDGVGTLEILLISKSALNPLTNCLKSKIRVTTDPQSWPFIVGVYCVQTAKEVEVNLSFPTQIRLLKSSLFESAGKGEPARLYNMGKINSSKGSLGSFEFTDGNKNWKLDLSSTKVETKDTQIPPSRYAVGTGSYQFKLRANNTDYQDTKYLLRMSLLPQKLRYNLSFGGDLEGALGGKASELKESFSYSQITFYGGWYWGETKTFTLWPELYYVWSSQSSGSGVDYLVTNFGAGVTSRIKFGPRWILKASYYTIGISSPVIKSHSFVKIDLSRFINNDLNQAIGISYIMQTYIVLDLFNNERKFSNQGIVLDYRF